MATQAGNGLDDPSSQLGTEASSVENASTSDAVPSTANEIPEMASGAFQAINSRAVAENATTAVNTAAPPRRAAAVAQDDSQMALTAPEVSTAPDPATHADDVDDNMAADAATYGTRSRNRTGNARPNYAEDQDADFELSSAATTKKKPSATDSVAESKRAQDFARLISGGSNDTPNGIKEATPGTPGIAPNSKKRKAAGPPANITQTPPASHSPAPVVTRKVAAPSASARETNIMTFTKHRSCLNKKGELIADDGTKLSVNGKHVS